MKAIKILAIACIVCVIASCGVLKNKSKSEDNLVIRQSAQIEYKGSEQSGSKSEVKEQTLDKGTIVTERETKKVTTTEGAKGKITIGKGELKPGENYLRDTAGNEVKVVLDSLNKTLSLEWNTSPKKVEETTKEKITEQKDQKSNKEGSTDDSTKKEVAVQARQVSTIKSQEIITESKPNVWAIIMNNIGWAIGFLIIVMGAIWWFFGSGRKK